MRNILIVLAVAVAALIGVFACSSLAADPPPEPDAAELASAEEAIFAGGCFWCVESDFDKVDGVLATVSGYIGGEGGNPTYKNHGERGYYEAVRVSYDPARVDYETLTEYFFRHVDPTDPGGQFCDRGDSYRTAIFALDQEQAGIAREEIAEIEASGQLAGPVVTPVLPAEEFTPAEDYHQDYYIKNPVRYGFYRRGCGRDARIEAVWSGEVAGTP